MCLDRPSALEHRSQWFRVARLPADRRHRHEHRPPPAPTYVVIAGARRPPIACPNFRGSPCDDLPMSSRPERQLCFAVSCDSDYSTAYCTRYEQMLIRISINRSIPTQLFHMRDNSTLALFSIYFTKPSNIIIQILLYYSCHYRQVGACICLCAYVRWVG